MLLLTEDAAADGLYHVMAHVVNTLTLYTLENGFITCLTTTASLICWLAMPNNLVFMGLHFVIGKLYANSLLVSLNTRKELREMRWSKSNWPPAEPVFTSSDFTAPYTRSYSYGAVTTLTMTSPTSAYQPAFKVNPRILPSPLEVSVERKVERISEELSDIIHNEYPDRRHHLHTEPWRSLP